MSVAEWYFFDLSTHSDIRTNCIVCSAAIFLGRTNLQVTVETCYQIIETNFYTLSSRFQTENNRVEIEPIK